MRKPAIATLIVSLSSLLCLAPGGAGAAEPDPAPSTDTDADDGEGDEQEGDADAALAQEAAKRSKKRKSKSKSKSKSRNDEACDFVTPLHWHEVEAGEHLGLIAGRYGVLSKDLLRLNPALAENPDHIRVGQKIAVCPEIRPRELVSLVHVVAPGETFNAIALHNELSPEALLEMQEGRLRDPNKLRVGDRLNIVVVGDYLPGFEPEAPQPGLLARGRKLPTHNAYVIKRSHNVYGTTRTIKLIGTVVDNYQRRVPGGPKLRIGDISKDGGGPMNGHLSHQEGRDLDIGLVLEGKLANRVHFSGTTPDNIDLKRTWTLIEEFIATGEVQVIYLDYELQRPLYDYARSIGVPKSKLDEYFQYPRGAKRHHGIIRHWSGHKNHLHVRFRK